MFNPAAPANLVQHPAREDVSPLAQGGHATVDSSIAVDSITEMRQLPNPVTSSQAVAAGRADGIAKVHTRWLESSADEAGTPAEGEEELL